MNKDCLLLITCNLNDIIYQRFLHLQNTLDMDIYLMFDDSGNENIKIDNKNIIYFNGNEIFPKYNHIKENKSYIGSVQYTTLYFYENFNDKYRYYWFMEDDIILEGGNYKSFFDKANNIDCDLFVRDYGEVTKNWYWIQLAEDKFKTGSYKYSSLLQLYRISPNALTCLSKNIERNYGVHDESSIISTIYNNNLSIKKMIDELPYIFNVGWENHKEYYKHRNNNEWYHPIKSQKLKKYKIQL